MDNDDDCILIWDWVDAPAEYARLSTHGGDEEGVAFIPRAKLEYGRRITAKKTPFAPAAVSEHRVKGGVVRIGAHS